MSEREEFLRWASGEHSLEEWRAGLDFWSRPWWQRFALRILGVLLDALVLR